MEGNGSWDQRTLIGEMTQGMELAKQLSQSLGSKGTPETREFLVQRILGSYEKALLILECTTTPTLLPPPPPHQQPHGLGVVTCHSVPESPVSAIDDSPRSDQDPAIVRGSKKRKALPRWTDQVRVNCENGLEGPQEDGFSWRKYGQKDILQAKYPRSYYRCTFKNTQSCLATKQVQRSDEDPYLFDITYRGNHTCSQVGQSQAQAHAQAATCQDLMVVTEEGFSFPSTPSPSPAPYSYCFGAEDGFGGGPHLGLDDEAFVGCFTSPATPEQDFSPFGGSKSGIVSAETSASNSPIIPELGFSVEIIDPNFPFDAPGFFN